MISRLKAIPHGIRSFFDDALANGAPGAALNAVSRFGSENARARQTIGEDVGGIGGIRGERRL